ncbi:unnamed protein product [Adineta steineri]|uniref:Enoyl reductase (ER) domain-containing protein n=1 Tax=Adineta steineri TaxID=433720 RepID=A0A819WXB3_9BILA|nr:unnamed protein product [Adineta steineri]CAF4131875.1 unnamed protein product [Adineta steineri]
MLQKSLDDSNEQEKSKYEQISIIPKRDADQKAFRICVPQSRFLSQLTWIEKDKVKESLAEQPKVNRNTEPDSKFVGTIVRIGLTTTNFQTGDHVVGATSHGTYHSHIMINSQFIIRIPSSFPLTDEQLCSLPCSILTVIYSLKYRVHLRAGQTVLIHAARGGAGQICIQYCQYIGARIFAIDGTEEKRRFLCEYYDIEHVFNSRDTCFVNQIREILPEGCGC